MIKLLDSLLNGPSHYTVSHDLSPGMTLVVVLVALFAEFVSAYVIFMAVVRFVENIPNMTGSILRKFGVGGKPVPHVFLELTFPADTAKSAFATEQLYIMLRGQRRLPFWAHLAAPKRIHSLELASTRDDGIRYILSVPINEIEYVEHSLRSYMPGLKIRQVEDYLKGIIGTPAGVVELKLGSDFVLPLQDLKILKEHDPIAYLTGHMTKLSEKELISFQIVTTPVYSNTHRRTWRHVTEFRGRIKREQTLSTDLKKQRSPLGYLLWILWYPPLWFIKSVARIIMFLGNIISAFITNDHKYVTGDGDKRRSGDPYEAELGKTIKSKLDQNLYEVTMRILVVSPNPETIERRISAVIDSLKPFSTNYQSISVHRPLNLPFMDAGNKQWQQFKNRELTSRLIGQQTILSSGELSDLYHFPNTDLTKTEGFVKSRSRELAAPLSVKHSQAELDVIVGLNEHGGDEQPVGLTLEQRQKHTYVIGKTGMGKTTLLTNAIYQDMMAGKGLAVLDPHGDMFQELLSIVPEHRRKDVVVFDPSDRSHPIGLNILDPGIDFADEDEKHERISSSVLSVFQKLADEQQWGPRMEHILRSATLTALQTPKPSLYTLQRLLTDKTYQREVAKNLKDPVLKQFWDKEFKLMGTMQLSSATAPLTNRLGHFITSKMSRHILLQEESTIRIADIMNEGKILLVNLSKGDIGEDQSRFFGTIITSFIWMAAYQRTKIPERKRRDFFLYVDEFQNFATPVFSDIVTEGRKFHISIVVSHQSIAQIEDKALLKLVAGNASTIISLKVSPEDEIFILPYMKPVVEKGDIVNLAPFQFYIKTTGAVSEDAFSGHTVPLDVEPSSKVKDAVVEYSRKHYGTTKAKVEKYMKVLFGQIDTTHKSKDKVKPRGL